MTFQKTFLDRAEAVAQQSRCLTKVERDGRGHTELAAYRVGGMAVIAAMECDFRDALHTATLRCPRLGIEGKVWKFTEDDGERADLVLSEWRQFLAGGGSV